ncbi:MAG: site-2 protease family protein [Mycobacteriales bacterium]|nr:MAG: site-2 protease family protein [Pseudonocardiales bacterium]
MGPAAGQSGQPRSGQPRPAGLPAGRYFGVPVYFSPSWFLFAGYITLFWAQVVRDNVRDISSGESYFVAFGFAVLLAASVLLHELGHCVVSLALGLKVRRVVLFLLGGVSEIETEPDRPSHEYLVAMAGPLVSLLLAGAGAAGYPHLEPGSVQRWLVVQLMLSNLGVMLFNLLPGLPLDGGRLLRAGVWSVSRSAVTGTKAAALGGRGIAVLVILGALYAQTRSDNASLYGLVVAFVLAAFIWIGAGQALRAVTLRASLPRLQIDTLVRPALEVTGELSVGEAVRRARDAQAGGLVVVGGDGRPFAVVSEAAILGVPEQRRPWTAIGDVARSLDPRMVLADRLTGEALLKAIEAYPVSEYLVVRRDGSTVGILATADVAKAFDALAASGQAR